MKQFNRLSPLNESADLKNISAEFEKLDKKLKYINLIEISEGWDQHNFLVFINEKAIKLLKKHPEVLKEYKQVIKFFKDYGLKLNKPNHYDFDALGYSCGFEDEDEFMNYVMGVNSVDKDYDLPSAEDLFGNHSLNESKQFNRLSPLNESTSPNDIDILKKLLKKIKSNNNIKKYLLESVITYDEESEIDIIRIRINARSKFGLDFEELLKHNLFGDIISISKCLESLFHLTHIYKCIPVAKDVFEDIITFEIYHHKEI